MTLALKGFIWKKKKFYIVSLVSRFRPSNNYLSSKKLTATAMYNSAFLKVSHSDGTKGQRVTKVVLYSTLFRDASKPFFAKETYLY